MAEQKVENVTNVSELLANKVEIQNLNQKVNELQVDKQYLQKLLDDKKKELIEKEQTDTIEIYRVNKKVDEYPWGEPRRTTHRTHVVTTTKNEALDVIKNELKSSYEKEIEVLEDSLKAVRKELNERTDALNIAEDENVKAYNKRVNDLRENYTKRIKTLEEELTKVKNDKDTKALDKKRAEELATLNEHIKILEEQINGLTTGNVFKRWWFRVTKVKLVDKLTREYAKIKERANRIIKYYETPRGYDKMMIGSNNHPNHMDYTTSCSNW